MHWVEAVPLERAFPLYQSTCLCKDLCFWLLAWCHCTKLARLVQAHKVCVTCQLFSSSAITLGLGHLRAGRNRCPKEKCWCLRVCFPVVLSFLLGVFLTCLHFFPSCVYAVLLAICCMSSVSHSGGVKWKVFLLTCFMGGTDGLSMVCSSSFQKEWKVINVLPWLWVGFGYLGHMALLRNKWVFQDPQLPVGLTREMGRFVPCPFVPRDYVPAVKGFK